jgi:hypothetical protein
MSIIEAVLRIVVTQEVIGRGHLSSMMAMKFHFTAAVLTAAAVSIVPSAAVRSVVQIVL